MKKRISYFLIIVLIFISIHANQSVSAEEQIDLFVVPEYSSYLDPNFLELDILSSTSSAKSLFNAITIDLDFPINKLKIESIDYENGFCDLIAEENIDNEKGNLKLSCGNPHPELATGTNILKIKFNKIESGWAEISLNNSKILTHNGLGTNITGRTETHNFYIYK